LLTSFVNIAGSDGKHDYNFDIKFC